MSRFQQGSLFKLERKSRPDVWVFRWYESTSGKRRYKKQIIGTVTELRNRGEAEKAIIALRSSINAEIGTPKSVCDLAAHSWHSLRQSLATKLRALVWISK